MKNLIRKTFSAFKEKGMMYTFHKIDAYLRYKFHSFYENFYESPYKKIFGRYPARRVLHFEVALTGHCNLNCQNCNHFSPLSEEWFADLETFSRDIERLSNLFGKKAEWIHLLGGEPLLHPEVEKFFSVARSAFPNARIQLVTNGLLLSRKDDFFWRECFTHNIEISITVYPGMEKQFQTARDKGASFGVMVTPYGVEIISDNDLKFIKTSFHFPMDLTGSQSCKESFLQCPVLQWKCAQIYQGRLYHCARVAYIHLFNNYFGQSLPTCEQDSLDIYTAKNAKEILNFLARPIPFCRFCNVKKFSRNHPWGQTKKDIREWTAQ
jgi:organic radical activating enzyme